MKVSISFKEVNSEFDQEYADRDHAGQETVDNIKYNWEDELEVSEDVTDFKIHNNTVYVLEGEMDGKRFAHEIEGMTICECTSVSGVVSRFAISRKLIKETKKTTLKNGNVHFFIFLKDKHPHINPMPGIYISKKDFPNMLPLPVEEPADDFADDEEE